mmetsp:Transcript_75391/g.125698  ORF Transcript_75391/g.125698 Transcript_75391/m.125698 type:complete len:299 (+) Transcript_75391:228-1124(+)
MSHTGTCALQHLTCDRHAEVRVAVMGPEATMPACSGGKNTVHAIVGLHRCAAYESQPTASSAVAACVSSVVVAAILAECVQRTMRDPLRAEKKCATEHIDHLMALVEQLLNSMGHEAMREMDVSNRDEQQPCEAPKAEDRLAVLDVIGRDSSPAYGQHKVCRGHVCDCVQQGRATGNRKQNQQDRKNGTVDRAQNRCASGDRVDPRRPFLTHSLLFVNRGGHEERVRCASSPDSTFPYPVNLFHRRTLQAVCEGEHGETQDDVELHSRVSSSCTSCSGKAGGEPAMGCYYDDASSQHS